MKRLTTILLLAIGCAQHTPDVCRIAELQTLLSAAPEQAVFETEPTLQDRTTNLLSLKEGVADEAEFKVGDYCLYDYFRSNPPCPPCIRWSRDEKHLVGCKVKQWDTSERPLKFVTRYPTFRLLWCNTKTKEWDDITLWNGYVSADAINRQITAHKKTWQQTESEGIPVSLPGQQLRVRRSESDLRSWISKNYTPMTRLNRATVSPRSWVWTHLKQDHGFTQDQVGGLPQWMALALHDAVHPRSSPLITPWETR
jgi:hypothetical protein